MKAKKIKSDNFTYNNRVNPTLPLQYRKNSQFIKDQIILNFFVYQYYNRRLYDIPSLNVFYSSLPPQFSLVIRLS